MSLRVRTGLLAAAMLAASAGIPAFAQQPRKDAPQTLEIQSGNAFTEEEEGRKVIFLNGGVRIRRGEMEMTSDRALIWKRKPYTQEGPKDPAEASSIDEIYLEGGVHIQRARQELRADRLFMDLLRDKAMIIELRTKSTQAKMKESFYLSAKEARQIAEGKFEARDVSVTTCSYGVPHYHLSIERAILTGKDPRPREGPLDFFRYADWSAELEDIYPELMGAPLFFLPALVLSPVVKELPLRRLQGGRSTRFGEFVYSEWGTRLKRTDEKGKTRVWGDLSLEVDWRRTRGWGFGPKFEYSVEGTRGYIAGYYLHDLGRDPDLGFNSKFGPLEEDDRGKVRVYHRTDLDDHWRIELKAYYLSDRDLLEEFFESEFREEEEPETSIFLRYVNGPFGGFLEERYRLNDFQTQNEYLPRLNLSAFEVPILRGRWNDLVVTERIEAGHIRRRFDDETGVDTEQVWRVDSYTEIAFPFDLRYFQIFPFAVERLTYYHDDLQGDARLRSLSAAGVGASTQAHGTFQGVGWEWIGLRGLRHVMELEARWCSTLGTSVPPSDLYPFDAVDQLTQLEEVVLKFRHRFKTKDASGQPFEFLNFGVAVEYYPDPDRDTTFANATSYQLPFDYIFVDPDITGAFASRRWSNVHYDASFTPRNFLSASGVGEYNPETGREDYRSVGVTVTPLSGLRVTVGQTFVRNVTNAVTGSVYASLTPKWGVRLEASYDYHVDQFISQEFVVSRDFHDFMLEVVGEHNFSTRDRRIYVSFVPKFFGERGLHRSHIYNKTGLPLPDAP